MKQLFLAVMLCLSGIGYCQQKEAGYPTSQKELEQTIIALDAAAFDAYNNCDLEKSRTFFTEDVEFYHDKGGFMKGVDKLMESTKKNICGNPKQKIRREAVTDTFKVYPLDGYGAILTGDHLFYITENGKERLTGKAKFTHVWLLKDGKWKMARVLSYDHQGAQ
ncbi:nuclear transport factor 2 family protein [Flavobacterium sp. DGU11]|uniref:Nuclear transport factor 2 family protein n=1 Tax=Flavobacterium arundinis TaxID=3139143 RepID=A0ABU9HUS6_9FLAO